MDVLYRFTALGKEGMEMGGVLVGDYDVDEAMRRAVEHVRTGVGRPDLLVEDGIVLLEGAAFVEAVRAQLEHEAKDDTEGQPERTPPRVHTR
jgi:hypothetical protein